MCGIAGYFLKPGQPHPGGCLGRMRQALKHRGPDGEGERRLGQAGFAHTRLSIIDLADGAQPFVKGNHMLIANGEIYNHEDLRHDLSYAFESRSDCEVALPLWQKEGPDFVRKLRGMYALALYDKGNDRGLLARDPFGIKPLYYIETPAGLFFASEIRALREAGLLRDEAPSRLQGAYILDRQYAPVSPFENVRRVMPGEVLEIQAGSIISRHRDRPLETDMSEEASLQRLDRMLESSIQAHLLSDVPYGMFLSGGVDSACILAMMARLNTAPVNAYTVVFDTAGQGRSVDESRLASHLCEKLGARHSVVPFGADDFDRIAGLAALACDDPVADYAILPTLHLAKRAAEDVKVILSGEGGDEFFAGYGRYRSATGIFRSKPMRRPGPALRADILQPDLAQSLRQDMYQRADKGIPLIQRILEPDASLRQVQARDIEEWLPDNLLIKLDRCLMRHGVEGRTPFIDRELSAYGYHLPRREKINSRQGKFLLKTWLHRELPEAEAFSRKRGFTVPVGEWIAQRADTLVPLLRLQPGLSSLVREGALEPVIRKAAHGQGQLAWRLLFYALWHQIHIGGVAADQPIRDILAAR
ncbi:asparagine synthase (glutamine-hydrolyzing) [Alphaproteobacteria bacterium LSUCC0684]